MSEPHAPEETAEERLARLRQELLDEIAEKTGTKDQ
ncbi:hypothetical protein YIM_48335 (plasmid) [Amycolatopsis sp. YIM 10]|nr:hypothetical protein YIM_13545 [Amycolatopsis sp. YIM 10]QFU94792.1 hypothetical protein YIM_48335 [Amycolatopsis sp. YIM 10]